MKFFNWLIAYDDWQALPVRDKILIPVLYFGGLATYYVAGVLLK